MAGNDPGFPECIAGDAPGQGVNRQVITGYGHKRRSINRSSLQDMTFLRSDPAVPRDQGDSPAGRLKRDRGKYRSLPEGCVPPGGRTEKRSPLSSPGGTLCAMKVRFLPVVHECPARDDDQGLEVPGVQRPEVIDGDQAGNVLFDRDD